MIPIEGIKVESSKTDAVTKMSVPQSLTDLQRFSGMVNYLGKFIPNLAEVSAPFRALLKRDVVFDLQKLQLDANEKLKTLIRQLPFYLKIVDANLPARLKIDASFEGLGALLKQNHGSLENPQWHSIGYSSYALRDYEKRYAQIEKYSLCSFWSRTFPRIFLRS